MDCRMRADACAQALSSLGHSILARVQDDPEACDLACVSPTGIALLVRVSNRPPEDEFRAFTRIETEGPFDRLILVSEAAPALAAPFLTCTLETLRNVVDPDEGLLR